MLVREVISQRAKPFRSVCALQISAYLVDAATMCYLELFQITVLLYGSSLLHRVIQISLKVCIDVALYDVLFYHLHNREKFLSPLRITLTIV